ncbi:MAG: hypothetical protein ACWA5K_04970 [bacterium]
MSLKTLGCIPLIALVILTGCSTQKSFFQEYPDPETLPEAVRQHLGATRLDVSPEKTRVLGFGDGYGAQGYEVAAGAAGAMGEMMNEINDPSAILILPFVLPFVAAGGAIEGGFDKVKHEKNKATIDGLAEVIGNELARDLSDRLMTLSEQWAYLTGENRIVSDQGSDQDRDAPGLTTLALSVPEVDFAVEYDSNRALVTISSAVELSDSARRYNSRAFHMSIDVANLPLRKIDPEHPESLIALIRQNLNDIAVDIFNKIYVASTVRLPLQPAGDEQYAMFDRNGISEMTTSTPVFRWQLEASQQSVPAPDYFLFFNETPEVAMSSGQWGYPLKRLDWSKGVRVDGFEYRMQQGMTCKKLQRWTVQPVFETESGVRLGVPMRPVHYKSTCKS